MTTVIDYENFEITNKKCQYFKKFSGILFVIGAFCVLGLTILNLVNTLLAVICFSYEDVEAVCPNSQLWWYALFIGIIWPILFCNRVRQKAEYSNEVPISEFIFVIIILTFLIIWGWDQLWGFSEFHNNRCAMDNWQTSNNTEFEMNEGHNLFIAVERWVYIFIFIDIALIIGTWVFLIYPCCDDKKYKHITIV